MPQPFYRASRLSIFIVVVLCLASMRLEPSRAVDLLPSAAALLACGAASFCSRAGSGLELVV